MTIDGRICIIPYIYSPVCGTDGVTYVNTWTLECVQSKEYGKRVHLEQEHRGACWIWEKYGLETSTVFHVSKLRTDSISLED